MNSEIRKAAFVEARAESLDILERIADIKVERRDHSEPDALEQWRAGMPPKLPPVTLDEVRNMMANAVAGLPRALRPEAAAAVIHEVRKQLRQETAVEVEKLNAEIEQLKRGISADHGATVHELPNPLRSARRV